MSYSNFDLESLRLLSGECMIEIEGLLENEIDFNGGKLMIVSKIKNSVEEVDPRDLIDTIKSMQRHRYKDAGAFKEYGKMLAESKKEADAVTEDEVGKQAVRRGKIVKVSEKNLTDGGWDFSCKFDGVVGDEVWFDATYTRDQMESAEKLFEKDGKTYILIPEQSIYAAKRGDEIVSLNGYIIGKVLPNDRTYGSLFLPDAEIRRVEVVVEPARDPIYRNKQVWKNTKVKKGDIVCIKPHFATRLDPTLANSTEYVRFQSRIILAIEE
jgi:hypothetical protein